MMLERSSVVPEAWQVQVRWLATVDGVSGGDGIAPLDYLLFLKPRAGAAQRLATAISKVVQSTEWSAVWILGVLLW